MVCGVGVRIHGGLLLSLDDFLEILNLAMELLYHALLHLEKLVLCSQLFSQMLLGGIMLVELHLQLGDLICLLKVLVSETLHFFLSRIMFV